MAFWQVARVLSTKELRTRWRALVLLGLLTALWAGATMTAVAGARRTASVVDRFQRETSASDASFSIAGDRDGDHLLHALENSPEVDAADSIWFGTTGLAFDQGLWVELFGGTESVWGRDFDQPIVVHGRTADSASATEVMVTEATAALLNVGVGDHLAIPTWDRAVYEAWWNVRGRFPPFDGPLIDVVVVGVVELAKNFEFSKEEGLLIVVTPAFFERWGSSIAREQKSAVASFSDDGVDAVALADRLSSQVGATVRAVTSEQAYSGALRDATNVLTIGLVVLAILVGVVGAMMVGLGVAREVRAAAVRNQPLRALGATSWQRATVLSIPIAVVGCAAMIVAAIAAGFASTLFPLGPGQLAEPVRGVWIDLPVMAGGALAIVFMLTVSAVAALRRDELQSSAQVSRSTGRSIVRWLGPAARVGYRNAVGSRQAQATVMIAAVTITGLTGTAWFIQSLDDLGASRQRWGYTWSSSPEWGFTAAESEAVLNELIRHPDVANVGYLDTAVAVIDDGMSVPIASFSRLTGRLISPVVLEGRLPTASLDIALGEQTARALHLRIGDSVKVDSTFAPPREFVVVGLVVPPFSGTEAEPGVGVLTTAPNFERLSYPFESVARVMLIEYRDGADVQEVENDLTTLGFRFEFRSHARPPRGLANVLGVRVVAIWLGGFFLLLGALATVLAAIRQRTRHARDFDILRSLGFHRRDIGGCAFAEAATIVMIGLLAGVPLGLIVGNQAWRLTVGELGVVDAQSTPMVVVLAMVGLAALATVGAALLGRRIVSQAGADRERLFQNLRS